MIACLHCHTETSNGLALCEACRIAVLTYLEFLPVYYRNLARWKPTRSNSRSVPGSRIPVGVLGTGSSDRIARVLDETGDELIVWARKLADARPYTARVVERIIGLDELATITLLCKLYERRLASIATLDWCGDFVASIRHMHAHLQALTERLVPGWYAGACNRCGTPTFVVPGLTWVTCSSCGTTTHAAAHVDVILAEALDWIAPPMRLAEAIVVLVDAEHSIDRLYERIRKWGRRGQLESLRALDDDGDPIGPHRYRLGDVLSRLDQEGATRQITVTYIQKAQ